MSSSKECSKYFTIHQIVCYTLIITVLQTIGSLDGASLNVAFFIGYIIGVAIRTYFMFWIFKIINEKLVKFFTKR